MHRFHLLRATLGPLCLLPWIATSDLSQGAIGRVDELAAVARDQLRAGQPSAALETLGEAADRGLPLDAGSTWIGLRSFGDREPVFRRLSIAGQPDIPREFHMSRGDSQRGWEFGTATEENVASSAGEWFAKDGIIYGGRRAGEEEVAVQNHLAYQRPPLNDESISDECYYEPGQTEVHPALGRLAFLIEPDGVRLHRLTNGVGEWTGLSTDNAVAEPLNRRGPKPLPLKTKDWNRVTVSLARDIITLSLNDAAIYSWKMELEYERTFGIYHDRRRSEARVRNVVLRGDWPEQLTASQLANPAAVADPDRSPAKRRALAAASVEGTFPIRGSSAARSRGKKRMTRHQRQPSRREMRIA